VIDLVAPGEGLVPLLTCMRRMPLLCWRGRFDGAGLTPRLRDGPVKMSPSISRLALFAAMMSLRVISRSHAQERLDRAALVHRAVAFRYLIERQREIENLPGLDRTVCDQLD
jgi:hypothetical protein